MTDLLHPIGDGFSFGDITIVGADGVERFPVLTPLQPDDNYVGIVAEQGRVFDQFMQARGPIAFGDGVIRGRFKRAAGDGGIEITIGLWRENPRYATGPDGLIATTKNFQIWQDEWTEYALQLTGRDCDLIAKHMGDLWIRVVVIAAIDGTDVPTLGVSSLWIEVPDAAEGVTFQDPSTAPENTLVTVRTESGRSGTAKRVAGEWKDASDQPFEAHSSSLPPGSDGRSQPSRAVDGWG